MMSRQHGSLGDLACGLHSRHGPGFGWSFLGYVGRAFLGSNGMLVSCRMWEGSAALGIDVAIDSGMILL